MSFKSQEDLDLAFAHEASLGNTELKWTNLSAKLCFLCDSTEHSVKDCPKKQINQQFRDNRREKIKKHGHLYQRYQTQSAAPLIKFMETQQRFKNKSFAQAVKGNPSQRRQQFRPLNIPQPIPASADL